KFFRIVKINFPDFVQVIFLTLSNLLLAQFFFWKSEAIMNAHPKIMVFDKRVKNFDIDVTMSSKRG
ncbi:MAG TPA: hypothetical protein VJP58_02470, partial [Candidatus Nitrosocosmicus sp.]|nr:hypothetical protein [Candidatus Nitrosocosmicus sp.]